tara:strand:+ start:115 stop:408 length:294 start_codon:yes stop_codon:yes gene_type:complete
MDFFQATFIPGVMLGLTLLSAAYLYRVLRGPTVFDRVLGLNGISTKVILLLLVIGTANGRVEMFVDIALGYALLNLVGSLAIAKYLEHQGDALNAMD